MKKLSLLIVSLFYASTSLALTVEIEGFLYQLLGTDAINKDNFFINLVIS